MAETFISLHQAEIAVCMCLLILLLCAGSVANVLVVYAIHRKKQLQNSHNVLIQNLCLSNLIICLFTSVTTMIILLLQVFGISMTGICYTRHVTVFASLFANFGLLTALSLEKHDVILNPFRRTFTKKKAKVSRTIGIIWLVTIAAVIAISVEYWNARKRKCFNILHGGSATVYHSFSLIACATMCIISLYCYVKIILVLKSHGKLVRAQTIRRSLQKQTLKMVSILMLGFLAIWLPAGILRIIRTYIGQSQVLNHLYVFSSILICFPSLFHPVTCILLNRRIRLEIKSIIGMREAVSRDSHIDFSTLNVNQSIRFQPPPSPI